MTTPTLPSQVSTSSHYRIRLSINGVAVAECDTRTGGRTVVETTKRSINGVKRVTMGGPRDTEDVVVTWAFVAARDWDLIRQYQPQCGLATATVTQVPLDVNRREMAVRPIMWTGTLMSFGPPEADNESADPSVVEVSVSVDGDPS